MRPAAMTLYLPVSTLFALDTVSLGPDPVNWLTVAAIMIAVLAFSGALGLADEARRDRNGTALPF